MAWIYLKESPVLASAPESGASTLRLKDGLSLTPTVSEIPTRKELSSHVSETDDYPMRRYGTTLQRSELATFPGLEPLSAVLPVKISAWPAMERAWKVTEDSLCLNSSASLASADHSSSCWKTYQDSFFEGLTKFSWDSMRSGMTVGGRLFQPKRLEPRFSETDCSLWPRPVASDTGTWINRSQSAGAKDGPSLGAIAKNWNRYPRPNATDSTGRGYQRDASGKIWDQMPGIAQKFADRWARPQARDWKEGDSPEKHGKHSDSIAIQAQKTGHHGYLNPLFHSAQMGYDSDHTQLDAVGMAWFLSKQKSRLSALWESEASA